MPSRRSRSIRPLTPTIGAVIEGIDLSQTLDDAAVTTIRAALLEHQVLFFEGQDLSPSELRDFAARFGALYSDPSEPKTDDLSEITIIDEQSGGGGRREIWHADVSYLQQPPLGSILYARNMPDAGVDTAWASTTAAFGALSKLLQDFLMTLEAEHDVLCGAFRRRAPAHREHRSHSLTAREQPPVYHPVVRRHPETGLTSLFVNDLYTSRIVGLTPEESDLVLRHLVHHIQRPEFAVRWQWKQGQLAFWDNRCTQHRTLSAHSWRGARIMYHAALIGDRPRPLDRQMTKSGT